MAKDVYYFSHDCNARHDPKITAMRSVYGIEGVGRFWVLIEMMREADGFKLSSAGKYVWNAYAKEMECKSSEDALQFIQDCIEEFDLFDSDGQYFWSRSLLKRMDKKEQVKQKRIDAANARWNKTASDKDSSITGDASEMQMECKCIEKPCKCDPLKETKLKEIKLKEIKEDLSLSISGEKLNILDTLNKYKLVADGGVRYLEDIESYQNMMEDALILDAIKRSAGRKYSFCKGILSNWNLLGYKRYLDVPENKPKEGGSTYDGSMDQPGGSRQGSYGQTETTGGIDITRGQTGRIHYEPRD